MTGGVSLLCKIHHLSGGTKVNETRRNASPKICHAARVERGRAVLIRAPGHAALRCDQVRAFPEFELSRLSPIRVSGTGCSHRRQSHPSRGALKQTGFTIIELMIVVVIVAILAMIAYPSYEDHLRKGRRSAAMNFLSDVATKQQQYLLDARQYAVGTGALGALNMSVPNDVAPFYAVTVNPAAPTLPPTFTLVATPIPGTKQVPDGALTLDSAGAKTRNGQPGWK